jgi:thiamine kinase-like enzyme
MGLNETFLFPDIKKLNPQLERIINKVHSPLHMVKLINRKPYDYRSTSPAEIISVSLDDGQIIALFCKYSGSHTQYSYGHRGGVEYETLVYKNILNKISLRSARYYGIFKKENNETCLVIEYLKSSKLLKDSRDPRYFGKAAAWIGNLHRMYESRLLSSIKIYNEDYYMIWLKRVESLLEVLKERYPWLPSVCNYFKENLHFLSDSMQTFIHGEYYTKNILIQKGIVYPIDWESAAIGPGEIDLASLIEDWDENRKNIALKSYLKARWPDGNFSESEFRKRLLLVKIYFFLRWTGEYIDPEIWLNRASWFENFYQLIKLAGYRQKMIV